MIDILNLRNGMEDNLLLIQQINLMIQKKGEELKGFNDVIHAAKQHIESINSVYTLGLSWLTGHTDSFIFGKILFNNRRDKDKIKYLKSLSTLRTILFSSFTVQP